MEIEMKCIMGKLNHPNHNGRIYNSDMMENAINKWKKDGNKMVELAPDYGQLDHFSESHIKNIVGSVKDIWIENGNVFGKVQLLDTPRGKIAKEMINAGKEFQISPRMLGEKIPVLDEEGNPKFDDEGNQIYEIKDVNVISFDIV